MGYAEVSVGALADSLTPAFGATTQAGHLLVAWLSDNSSSAASPFSTTAPGWLLAAVSGNAFCWNAIYYKPNCGAGETAPVFTDSGESTQRSMLGEFSGGATSSPLNQAGTVTGTSALTIPCSAPDSLAGSLIIANATWTGNGAATTITSSMTDSSGSTVSATQVADIAGNSPEMNMAYLYGVAGATGADDDTAVSTIGVFSGGAGCIASFQPAAAAAAPGRGLTVTRVPVARAAYY